MHHHSGMASADALHLPYLSPALRAWRTPASRTLAPSCGASRSPLWIASAVVAHHRTQQISQAACFRNKAQPAWSCRTPLTRFSSFAWLHELLPLPYADLSSCIAPRPPLLVIPSWSGEHQVDETSTHTRSCRPGLRSALAPASLRSSAVRLLSGWSRGKACQMPGAGARTASHVPLASCLHIELLSPGCVRAARQVVLVHKECILQCAGVPDRPHRWKTAIGGACESRAGAGPASSCFPPTRATPCAALYDAVEATHPSPHTLP